MTLSEKRLNITIILQIIFNSSADFLAPLSPLALLAHLNCSDQNVQQVMIFLLALLVLPTLWFSCFLLKENFKFFLLFETLNDFQL